VCVGGAQGEFMNALNRPKNERKPLKRLKSALCRSFTQLKQCANERNSRFLNALWGGCVCFISLFFRKFAMLQGRTSNPEMR